MTTTTSPAPVRPHAAFQRTSASPAWQLLAPGDEVSIAGQGAYVIVHLSHGRAWLSGRQDDSQLLAEVSNLQLRRSGYPARLHN